MEEPKKADRRRKRGDYAAGANGEQDVHPGPIESADTGEGQLGPDEISEPEEVVKNNEAKLHH